MPADDAAQQPGRAEPVPATLARAIKTLTVFMVIGFTYLTHLG